MKSRRIAKRVAERPETAWRSKVHEVIFEAETPLGRAFDIVLLWMIIASVLAVMLETMDSVRVEFRGAFRAAEWFFTLLFTVEYVLRLLSVTRPLRYAVSFYGIVDLLAIVPTYLSVLLPGTQSLLVIRALRLMRLFRVLKLSHFVREGNTLFYALRASRRKITVFLGWILGLVTVLGTAMYLIEGEEAGFTSAPRGIYWAIVTITTVGYGDIAPQTSAGQVLAAFVMLLGYCIIAVPTGIVSAEIARAPRLPTTESCPACSREGHDPDAEFCKFCGTAL